MAGNFNSGRPRTRARIEDTPKVCALDFARENGLPTVERETPGGEVFELGTCPKCEQPRRHLFETSAETVCRRCAGLSYRSNSESNSIAQIVRRDPEKATGEALQTMQNALGTGDGAKLGKAAHVLEIAATTAPATASSAPDFLARVQEAVIREDLARSSALIEGLFDELMSKEETRVDKRGNVEKIPMRPDSQARLLGAFVSVSNLRANRAGIATQIHAAQEGRPDSIRELIFGAMEAEGHTGPSGKTMGELLEIQRRPQQPEGE